MRYGRIPSIWPTQNLSRPLLGCVNNGPVRFTTKNLQLPHHVTHTDVSSLALDPGDIFTILMIIGGDVVQVAIAQLCAGPIPFLTPVVFSFGWVGYVVSAMLSAVGDNRLMPNPEVDCCVINAKNGYNRSNYSWERSRKAESPQTYV